MLDIEESQRLMFTYVELKKKHDESKSINDLKAFRKHEQLCIEKFRYIITMRTNRYKNFSNYEDLNQDGMEALLKAMKTFNPKKNSLFFWWAHKYIDTRIARSANLHTTIRYPLKVAKENIPHRETTMPLLIEDRYCPDKELEISELSGSIRTVVATLGKKQREIISLAFGFDGGKPVSVNKLCKKFKVSRVSCIKIINDALSLMKERIKI